MPLVVPVLRLAYVFLNVFDTFKVLRLPPPSARNGGQPSARAMSQRKRAMKGTMTVWMVWACFTLYERWVETIVWLFIPFYGEIKALVILFFLLTRAKGAEPIYLHILRPVIKPYSAPLDALFDGLSSVGDLLLLMALIPVQRAQDYYRRWTSALDPPDVDVRSWHPDAPRTGGRPTAHRAYVSEANGDARGHAARDVYTGSLRQARSAATASGSSTPARQIWYPPASAYSDEASLNPHSGLPTPPIDHRRQLLTGPPDVVDEWRQYPPFPSAYPPTPLPASSHLPSAEPPIAAPRPVRPSGAQFSGIDEESDEDNDAHLETRQGFRRSLLLPREPQNPGSDGDLSDEDHMKGVQRTQSPQEQSTTTTVIAADGHLTASEMSLDEGGGSDMDDEDDFNVTLRTPHPRKTLRRESMLTDDEMLTPPPSTIAMTMSLDSQVSRSTALSTTDQGSSLRTRTESISSTALSSVPDAPSLAGRKRRLPRYAEDSVKFNVRVSARKARATSRVASSCASSVSTTVSRARGKAITAQATEADEDQGALSDAPSMAAKRQKTTGGRIARPKPLRNDSEKTIREASVRSTSTSTARSTAARQPSSRIATANKDRPQLVKKESVLSTTSSAASKTRRAAAIAADTARPQD
ncbi:hypothetical protein BV20DRAFT_960040 [Pilatotrama ljubarskyi]|nr:hypothetical protein BV20DRAFT_960040 [Pilatotrama ljubarskyi]